MTDHQRQATWAAVFLAVLLLILALLALLSQGCGASSPFALQEPIQPNDAAVTYQASEGQHRVIAAGRFVGQANAGRLELIAAAQAIFDTRSEEWALLARLGAILAESYALYVEVEIDTSADLRQICVSGGLTNNLQRWCFPLRMGTETDVQAIEGEWEADAP
jgi:hypothetical protein